MDNRFGYYVFGGLLFGTLLGWAWSANGSGLLGIGIGVLAGVFTGWFIAAAVIEKRKQGVYEPGTKDK